MKTSKIVLLLAGVLLLAAVAPAQQPACQVTVAGQALALHPFAQGAFGLFELAQPAEIVVHTDFDVRWVDIRPKSSGVAAVIGPDHHTVRFRLGSALPVTVEFNDTVAETVEFPQAGCPQLLLDTNADNDTANGTLTNGFDLEIGYGGERIGGSCICDYQYSFGIGGSLLDLL